MAAKGVKMAAWTTILVLAPEVIRLAGDLIGKINKNKKKNLERPEEPQSLDERVAFLRAGYKELLDISEQQSELIQNLARQNSMLAKRVRINQFIAYLALFIAAGAVVVTLL